MERIEVYIQSPWWKLKAIIAISPAKKYRVAKAYQQRIRQVPTQDLVTYTDGSGHNGHIGAAIFSSTTSVVKGEYIGMDDIYNAYAAELTAIQMAITLFEEK